MKPRTAHRVLSYVCFTAIISGAGMMGLDLTAVCLGLIFARLIELEILLEFGKE
ncbi:hypothetical protein [Brucella anthropi]|uniref:hypothetical protein n=1 Tax=Brucella anthropi TaxID=529 RepID=UPI00398801B3